MDIKVPWEEEWGADSAQTEKDWNNGTESFIFREHRKSPFFL